MERGGNGAGKLSQRLRTVGKDKIVTSIISYEEQIRGWLGYLAKARTIEQQVEGYRLPKQQLTHYCEIPVLEFDQEAAQAFQRLKNLYPRIGTMDLKIASVAIVNQAIVLTRNTRDFGQVADLSIEDWTY